MKKRTRIILLSLLAVLVVIQFFRIDKTSPKADPAKDFVAIEQPPQAVSEMLKHACYDCHSNHAQYPWYTNIQPVGWWIKGHIQGAREELNYSEWADYNNDDKPRGLKEMAEEVEKGNMPLKSYTWMHPEARLTDAQRAELAAWFKSKVAAGKTNEGL
jgi:hypothetical protein